MSEPIFFVPSKSLTAAEIADLTGSRLATANLGSAVVNRIASAVEGADDALVYVEGRRNRHMLKSVRAAAILLSDDLVDDSPAGAAILVSRRPQAAFAAIGRLLFADAAFPAPLLGTTGVSTQAIIDPTAHLEDGVVVEPGAVIGPRVRIGAGTVIAPHAVIGHDCRIGRGCFIGPSTVTQYALIGDRVAIHAGAKIGQDGFGYVGGASGLERVPQIGRVVIQDGVEIGANTTIDRGALSDTVIGENSKIDNLVQIAHNVKIGRSCIIAGQCGLSGSVTLGDGVMLGGGVGIADHRSIGNGARVASGSGLMNDVPAGEVWGGNPAKPFGDALREVAIMKRLVKSGAWKEKGNG
jgi:UDP-3-O-[3-hydroxymyristoyl] glucosamine N-acyltransferase